MAIQSIDNVIRFPDGAKAYGARPDRQRTLRDARDLFAQKLREALRVLFNRIAEEMSVRGDKAEQRDLRLHCYNTRSRLQQDSIRAEALVAGYWLRSFDNAQQAGRASEPVKQADSEELHLVDFLELDEQLATKGVSSRLLLDCEEGLYAAEMRLAFLVGGNDEHFHIAELIGQALDATLKELNFAPEIRLEVLREAQSLAKSIFEPAIHELNAFLVGRQVLPKLRRSYGHAGRNKPTAGVDQEKAAASDADVYAMLQRLIGNSQTSSAVGIGGSANLSDKAIERPAATVAAAMEKVMASLDMLQHSSPSVSAEIPTTNLLRQFRDSDSGQQLGYLDAATVDIVATLFDFIFDDEAIADPIKVLIGRLQIPVLKVAMLDKSFFSSKAHPVRRLLDGVSRAAVRCGPTVGHDNPLYGYISNIIDRLQSEFTQDTALFVTLCQELDDFLDQQEQAADVCALRAAPLVVAQEQHEIAVIAARQALAGWLQMPLPEGVSELLDNEWRSLLVRHYENADDDAWNGALATVADLVASVQVQSEMKERKLLATRLPSLVRRIHEGLTLLAIPDGRRLFLVDSLFRVHAAVLRGAAPDTVTPKFSSAVDIPVAELEIANEHIEEGEASLDRISIADATDPPAAELDQAIEDQVAALHRGDWVEFTGAEGAIRYRLAWISPQRGILLFTNPDSPRALSVAPDALSIQIKRGEAMIVPIEPIFDRAVNRALETLKVA